MVTRDRYGQNEAKVKQIKRSKMAETPLISESCARDPFASQNKNRKAKGGNGNVYFQ